METSPSALYQAQPALEYGHTYGVRQSPYHARAHPMASPWLTLALLPLLAGSAAAFGCIRPGLRSSSSFIHAPLGRARRMARLQVPLAAQAVDESFAWTWDGTDLSCALTRRGIGAGTGKRVLLLPSMSSISTKDEMAALSTILAENHFETAAPDWPGFGTGQNKPNVAWTPQAMAAWLDYVLQKVVPNACMIVAAGHAAGYVLRHFENCPEEAPRLVLVAPTWRGPLPTMMRGKRPEWLKSVRAAVDSSVVGPVLYKMNLNELMVHKMSEGHVYSEPGFLSEGRMAQKRPVFQSAGARFASVRFVTGGLDPFESSEGAGAAAAALGQLPECPMQLIWGDETPHKSKAAMAQLAEAAGVKPTILQRGKLGLHEEFSSEVAKAILGDFKRHSRRSED